jgi:ArsR family transcriptional regulator, arsenate/arsenite/antimonite-responsive transcriptional repressor
MERLTETFKALSNETRLRIMALIFRHGPLCVCEVEQILGITQPKASRHLRYLRDAGVLEDERDGLLVNYGLPRNPDGDLSAILVLLRGLLADGPVPDAAPVLVRIRDARAEGRSAEAAVREAAMAGEKARTGV